MFEDTRSWVSAKATSLKGHFTSNKPHFNFITAHYMWIVGATIIASIAIYSGGRGHTNYIDALLFASGSNSQAGLNPVDVNLLNTFQQIIMYIFPMLSNPITLHGSVVILRLYWFEKRFQDLVHDVRQRRIPLSKSKSTAREDLRRMEEGVNGRHITLVAPSTQEPRKLANDGAIHESNGGGPRDQTVSSSGSESTMNYNDAKAGDVLEHHSDAQIPPAQTEDGDNGSTHDAETKNAMPPPHAAAGTITFAPTVKRSDGVEEDITSFMQRQSNYDHIAILERQRNQDNEVLRIPGPRDAERGLGPQRLDEDEPDLNQLTSAITRDSRPDNATVDSRTVRRNPAITIAEPEHRKRDEVAEDAKALGSTLDTFRLRKPRVFNKHQNTVHEDDEDRRSSRLTRIRTFDTIRTALSRDKFEEAMPYLSYTPTMGRNSNFVGLTLEQREELGGIEYRSLRTLAFILLGYFWGFHLLAAICLLPFILHHHHYGQILDADGIGRAWWAFWTANLSFMDVGFSLTPDSMIPFKTSEYVLMISAFFIVIGNTAFPIMLRFIIWSMSKLVPRGTGLWEELRFLLDHPRRCFTLLFPSAATWWLFGILVILNTVDVIFFIILDFHAPAVAGLSTSQRIVNGLYQAASTRTAGFTSVSLSELHPAMPVLYMIMMYISVFPIAISIRRTNVYEEKSLGVYHHKKDDDIEDEIQEASAMSYVGTHLRRQLSFDLWYVFLGFFLLAIAEGTKIQAGRFDMFALLFEIISAYGTVGMSLGATGINASLCSQFSVVGKLIIVAMEIRGRHRGLPYGLDRAVILPSESRLRSTEESAEPDIGRTMTRVSTAGSHQTRSRRGSSVNRRRSVSREADRNLITKILHPGPVVPPGVIHSHKRTKSNDSQVLSPAFSNMSRRPQSMISTVDEADAQDYELSPTTSPTASRPNGLLRTGSSQV